MKKEKRNHELDIQIAGQDLPGVLLISYHCLTAVVSLCSITKGLTGGSYDG